ncbi:oxt [Trypoxylus dichotomus]
MVVPRNVDNRKWMRRYRTFFMIGTLILCLQLYLAFRFFTINHASNTWSPHKLSKSEILELESGVVNSARRSKDGLSDDEDVKFNEKEKKANKHTEKYQFNKTVIKLRLEELDFVPVCEVNTKEAISAIHRARTQKCKQEISNTTCLIQKGLLYPKTLPNFCENENSQLTGKSLGCFKDEKSFRILSAYYSNNKENNSPEYCIYLCLQSGFSFAGVQYSTECFCGNDEPSPSLKLPDSSCNMKCPSDSHQVCGGYCTMNIYYTGVKKFIPQVANEATNSSESKVKIVFLLTLNGRALRQVKRLIKILFHVDHYFYIHVDIRQDYLFRELLKLEKNFHNMKLTRKRFATIWGGASLLKMLLSSMGELLKMNWSWDFVINLSESDYPVKTVKRLVDFLAANKNKNFVKSHGRDAQRFIQKQGLDKTFVECDAHMWRIGDRKLPSGVQIDGGSDWIALSHKFVSYVASDKQDELVEGLILLFKYTLLPAESFFHTVLRNSMFCNTYVDNNLHVTNWKRKLGCKCQYKHVVDWCGCSPNDFKPEDWLRIQNTESRQLFFARKFEPIINQAIILKLEQWLYGVDFEKKIINANSYWHNVYSHLDMDIPDDAVLTIGDSIARITAKYLSSDDCTVKSSTVTEVTYFHRNDIHKKTLVLFDGFSNNGGKVTFETGFKPKDTLIIHKKDSLSIRLNYLFVSSDYDQKEQVSRNFPRILGPYSEPTIIYEFGTNFDSDSKSYNVTFLWLDPTKKIAEASEVLIDDGFNVGHVKSTFKQPLLPGLWSVKLISKFESLAEVKFLIIPLRYYSRNLILQNQVEFINGGNSNYKDFDSLWDKFLNNTQQQRLEGLALANSKRFGPDLEEWIDSLVLKFFSTDAVCITHRNVNGSCWKNLPICEETNWSSLAPDPKSAITTINETSGMFDLW